jgi:hypothetical protein
MPDKLLARLTPWYDESYAATVMAAQPVPGVPPAPGAPTWVGPPFGSVLAQVRSIVAHMTAGWPRRDSANVFVNRYTVPGTPKRGIGTQFYISGDGTVARLIDLPRRTGHASFTNSWSLGVETGKLEDLGRPPSVQWIAATGDAQDVPGAKLWITSNRAVQTEVMPGWWTTASYNGPGRGNIGPVEMLFSESAYRSWALLARYMFERFGLPRNFPILPHVLRDGMMNDSASFRRLVLVDERADMMRRAFALAPINIQSTSFNPGNEATLQTEYSAAVAAAGSGLKQHNRAWREFFNVYRGLHGHGFSGAIDQGYHDHDCPGPLFDFHRLAREVSDYWWYPFDVGFRFDTGTETTAVPRRDYRKFGANTPLHEYFFDESRNARTSRITTGIHGSTGSPDTFVLDPESPIYAMTNGQLVAARFPTEPQSPPLTRVSLAFVLVRHEVFHLRAFPNIVLGGVVVPMPGTIDFDREPSSMYTLYMHLGRPAGMNFDAISDDNPDWLNRVLLRKKECDLGVAFYDDHPTHHGIAPAVWENRPPGVPIRPTTLEGWRADQAALNSFLNDLGAGNLAIAPTGPWVQPVRVLLGDFLGESGVIRDENGSFTHGIRVEAFSPSFVAPTFRHITGQTGWNPPPDTDPPCLTYQSEWARDPSAAELAEFANIGVDPALIRWWDDAQLGQLVDMVVAADARLPHGGTVVHYRPLEFADWINRATWAHEWPKYQVTDAVGNPVAMPAQPRSRRV